MKYNECHGHIAFGDKTLEEKLTILKKAGVTYWRDGGDPEGIGARHKWEIIDFGIKFVTPVYAIYKEGLYGKYLGQPYEDMTGYKLALRVAKYGGADYIKLILSGIASFKEPGKIIGGCVPEDEIREMVKIAHAEGMPVMAHCNGAQTIKIALDAGIDSLEHGIFIDDEGIEMLSKSDCVWVPTITAIASEEVQAAHRLSVEKANGQGAKIACGSDSGASGCELGKSTKNEYKALSDCGLEDAQITRADEIIKSKFSKYKNF